LRQFTRSHFIILLGEYLTQFRDYALIILDTKFRDVMNRKTVKYLFIHRNNYTKNDSLETDVQVKEYIYHSSYKGV